VKLSFEDRDTFYISGYFVETCLDTCDSDVTRLWSEFQKEKEILYTNFGIKDGFYGLMWYTENHRYCYLLGIETNKLSTAMNGVSCMCIPKSHYAITEVPNNMSIVEAWTEYFEKTLPDAGYIPNAEHGMYFEYYPTFDASGCQLWTPILYS
jgi:predicted transcriptional regulator YdeE